MTHSDADLSRQIGNDRFPVPRPLPTECAGCDWQSDESEHDHADYLGNFRTFEEWESHPSKALSDAISATESAQAGQSDWDSEGYAQERAEKWIEHMQRLGWRFVKVTSDYDEADHPGRPTERMGSCDSSVGYESGSDLPSPRTPETCGTTTSEDATSRTDSGRAGEA